jgi:putative flippase GtrA
MAVLARAKSIPWGQLWRFYQAAAVNTAFGFGLYAILITFGLNPFVAQAISFVCGVTFNYFTYSRHVFREGQPAKMRFIISYGFNYLLNVGLLIITKGYVANDYAAGAIVVLIASLLNYFALKHLVFKKQKYS